MDNTIKKYIYRFMSFESFVDMVQRKALAFMLHDKWEDPYESFILKTMRHKEGRQEILRILREMRPKHAIENFKTLLELDPVLFSQSWTECPESDALWRIYSHNRMSIRVQVFTTKTFSLSQPPEHVIPNNIIYSDSISIESQLKNIIEDKKKIKIEKIFFTKRNAFSHEQEIRLSTLDYTNFALQTPFQCEVMKELYDEKEITKKQYETFMNTTHIKKISGLKYVSYKHIPNFIESLMLHPLAPDWLDETARTFCENNNLNYIGKSKLYQFNYEDSQSSD